MRRRTKSLWRAALVGAMVLTLPSVAAAAVKLPAVFGNGMVLQTGMPVPVWGWAEPGEEVTVKFAGASASAKADAEGRWMAKLPAMEPSAKGREMTVSGSNTVKFTDVLVGEVWLCSGQSNMAMAVAGTLDAKKELAEAKYPEIRLLEVLRNNAPRTVDDIRGRWQSCAPNTARGFSAAGYFFGRKLHKELGVPIGLIDSSWGGTRIEPWTPPEGFKAVPELSKVYARTQVWDSRTESGKAAFAKALTLVKAWLPKAEAALAAGRRLPPQPLLPGPGESRQNPTKLYNGMIHPLAPYALRGAIWYQGEANGGEGVTYFYKTRALIEGWKAVWGKDRFPFYFVQLANFRKSPLNPAGGDGWARVREAQRKCLELPDTGMAVIIDIGMARNIHPKNKQDVGLRLALWALAQTYGKKEIVRSGPMYKSRKVEGSRIRLSFDQVGSGLMVARKEGLAPPRETPNEPLKWFAVAGADKKWHWAEAKIDGGTVVVSSKDVPKPVAVRFAYTMNPEGFNFYNREGLPASPFRTDTW